MLRILLGSIDTMKINSLGQQILQRCTYRVRISWEGGVAQILWSKYRIESKGHRLIRDGARRALHRQLSGAEYPSMVAIAFVAMQQ
jgi:hypothetical protein